MSFIGDIAKDGWNTAQKFAHRTYNKIDHSMNDHTAQVFSKWDPQHYGYSQNFQQQFSAKERLAASLFSGETGEISKLRAGGAIAGVAAGLGTVGAIGYSLFGDDD